MESLHEILAFGLRVSLFLTVLAIGLGASVADATYVLRQPRLLLRSLVAVAVVVPAFAVLLAVVLPLPPLVEIGIVLMAVSPLPPVVPAKELKLSGREAYVYGMPVAVALLSIVLVPVTVALLSAVFAAHAVVSPWAVARLLLGAVFVPLTFGMTVRVMWPGRAGRTAPYVGKFATLTLVVCMLPGLVSVAPALVRLIGSGTVFAIEAVVAVALAAGHWLGGPDPHDRVALALASATRHPAIALLIAGANSTDPSIKGVILLTVIVGMLTAIPYRLWVKRRVRAPQ